MRESVGFGNRLAAAAIDLLIGFVVLAPLAIFGLQGALVEALLPAAAVVFFWHVYGATPGKMALSARIVNARTGERPSLRQLLLRLVAYLISGLPLFLGFVWIAIDRRRQGWHDKIAGTMVVYDDD